MQGMPDLSAMFGKNGMPDLSKIPGLSLKHRITFKLMSLLNNPKLRFLKSRWSMPIWGLMAILVIALALVAGVIFLIYKLIILLIKNYSPPNKPLILSTTAPEASSPFITESTIP